MQSGVKIIDYQRLFDDKDEWQIKIDNIRKVLADNRPVIVGMCVFNSFTKVKDVWDGKNDGYYGCHALCIVGYDNDFLGGAFEVMNSWGTGWGDQGFAWITYETLKKTQSLQRAFEITLSGQEKRVRNQASDVGKNKAQILDKFTSNISFKLDDGTLMPIEIKTNKSRGLIVVKKDSLKNRSEESVEKSENKNMGHSPLTTLNSNNFISYASEKSYTSGTQYRAYIEVSHPTYLYVLGSDNTGEFSILFPADAKTSDFLSTKNCAIALPDENSLIQMDNTIGTDFMYFVYSNQKLDPNMLVSELKGKKGNANQKITERFKSALSKSKPLEIDDKNISFKTDNTDDKFFIISLEIAHK